MPPKPRKPWKPSKFPPIKKSRIEVEKESITYWLARTEKDHQLLIAAAKARRKGC